MKTLKKSITLALITALMVFSALMAMAQPLTHRGGNEMPAEILLVDLPGFQAGDIIYSAYQVEGQLYASWKDPAKSAKFFIRCMGNDGDTPAKTGVDPGENPVYLLYRNKTFTLLQVDRKPNTGYYGEATITITEDQATLQDNLYYSLCPQWSESQATISRITPAPGSYNYFYKFLNFNDVLPKWYGSMSFTLVTGTGKLTKATSVLMWRYNFTQADIDRGYIELMAKATAFKNCAQDDNARLILINIPKGSGQ